MEVAWLSSRSRRSDAASAILDFYLETSWHYSISRPLLHSSCHLFFPFMLAEIVFFFFEFLLQGKLIHLRGIYFHLRSEVLSHLTNSYNI